MSASGASWAAAPAGPNKASSVCSAFTTKVNTTSAPVAPSAAEEAVEPPAAAGSGADPPGGGEPVQRFAARVDAADRDACTQKRYRGAVSHRTKADDTGCALHGSPPKGTPGNR